MFLHEFPQLFQATGHGCARNAEDFRCLGDAVFQQQIEGRLQIIGQAQAHFLYIKRTLDDVVTDGAENITP